MPRAKPANERYRTVGGVPCIDIRVREARQLFDGRDPAPFRERDLDEDAMDFILAAAEELHGSEGPTLHIWIAEEGASPVAADEIVQAIRGHFEHELLKLGRRLRAQWRQGQVFLLVALVVLGTFLGLSELIATLGDGALIRILREGFVITGWVAMWKPLEVLLYDWRPLVGERRTLERVLAAPIVVHERSRGPGRE